MARLKVTTQPRARLPQLNDSPMSGDNWGSNVVLFTNLTTSITENNELMHVTATEILETLKHKIKMHDAFALSYVPMAFTHQLLLGAEHIMSLLTPCFVPPSRHSKPCPHMQRQTWCQSLNTIFYIVPLQPVSWNRHIYDLHTYTGHTLQVWESLDPNTKSLVHFNTCIKKRTCIKV